MKYTLLDEEWSIGYTPTPSKYVICHLGCMISTQHFCIRCWRNSPCLFIVDGKMHTPQIMVYHGRMLSWCRILRWLLWNPILPHTITSIVVFLPTLATLHLLLPSNLFGKLSNWDFTHSILVILLSFCLCAFEFFSLTKACVCYIKLHYNVLLLLGIQLHHQ